MPWPVPVAGSRGPFGPRPFSGLSSSSSSSVRPEENRSEALRSWRQRAFDPTAPGHGVSATTKGGKTARTLEETKDVPSSKDEVSFLGVPIGFQTGYPDRRVLVRKSCSKEGATPSTPILMSLRSQTRTETWVLAEVS